MIKDKDLIKRTKKFALKIIRLVASLPCTREADVIGVQLLKAGTSVGANYREANRARSKAEFRIPISEFIIGDFLNVTRNSICF
ncbi:MAG: four helix bundle protein [Desulfobacterales bacterium]|nr:MAG: four helix bundle protein [Desulfobacterales bacterium]